MIWTYRTTISVYHNRQSIELAHCVNARCADSALTILHIPQIEISTTPFRTRGTEFQVHGPNK